jgi:hypothetical protein
MTARIYPYPFYRNRQIVGAIARQMSALDGPKAEAFLVGEMDILWDHLDRRGLSRAQVETEVLAYAAAIRSVISLERAEILDRAVSGIGGSRRRDARPTSPSAGDPVLHIEIAPRKAKIIPLPGRFRGAEHVRSHVDYVLTLNAERGEQHVRRNLRAIRRTLEELGVDDDAIIAEVRRFEAAVRAELWRQVLLPAGDQ